MAKKKTDRTYIDAKGAQHKEFADGRTEIRYGWIEGESQNFSEVTDETDKSVRRRRFIPNTRPIETTLHTRDEHDDAVPGIDGLEDDAHDDED